MMSENDAPTVPRCGLYRTTLPVPGHADRVPAGRLVFFHNHSTEGPPLILLPSENQHNRWRFHRRGFLVADTDYLATLEPLKPEGIYRLREHFHVNDSQIVNRNALVQLGYNDRAEPILFFPVVHHSQNSLVFPVRGVKIDDTIYGSLDPLDLRGPHEPDPPQLH